MSSYTLWIIPLNDVFLIRGLVTVNLPLCKVIWAWLFEAGLALIPGSVDQNLLVAWYLTWFSTNPISNNSARDFLMKQMSARGI